MPWYLFGLFDQKLDERFVIHRFKATRVAILVGVLLMGGIFWYEFVTKKIIRWDLFIIMAAMAVSKVIAMIYYKKTN